MKNGIYFYFYFIKWKIEDNVFYIIQYNESKKESIHNTKQNVY